MWALVTILVTSQLEAGGIRALQDAPCQPLKNLDLEPHLVEGFRSPLLSSIAHVEHQAEKYLRLKVSLVLFTAPHARQLLREEEPRVPPTQHLHFPQVVRLLVEALRFDYKLDAKAHKAEGALQRHVSVVGLDRLFHQFTLPAVASD